MRWPTWMSSAHDACKREVTPLFEHKINTGAYVSGDLLNAIEKADDQEKLDKLLARVDPGGRPFYVIEKDGPLHANLPFKVLYSANQHSAHDPTISDVILRYQNSNLNGSEVLGDSLAHNGLIYTFGVHETCRLYVCGDRGIIVGGKPEDAANLLNDLGNQYRQLEQVASFIDEAANRDAMTGLMTRYQMDMHLDQIAATHEKRPNLRQAGKPYAIIMVDIDGFKLINDLRGHPAGNQILKQVANVMSKACPASAQISRWGGDEFLLAVADCADIDAVTVVAEQIRSEVKKHQFSITGNGQSVPISCTISLGVALYEPEAVRPHSVPVAKMLEKADQALLVAKGGGRVTDADHGNRTAYFDGNDTIQIIVKKPDSVAIKQPSVFDLRS